MKLRVWSADNAAAGGEAEAHEPLAAPIVHLAHQPRDRYMAAAQRLNRPTAGGKQDQTVPAGCSARSEPLSCDSFARGVIVIARGDR